MLVKKVYPYEEYTEKIKQYIATRKDWKFTRSVDIDDVTQLCHEYLFEKFNRNILNRSNFNATIVKAINDHPEYLCRKETVSPFVINLSEIMRGIINNSKLNGMTESDIVEYMFNTGMINIMEYIVLHTYIQSYSIQSVGELNMLTSEHARNILNGIIKRLCNKED